MPTLSRRFVVEMIGTFALVFFGCASVITNAYPGTSVGLVGVALAHAVALAIGVSFAMPISGGHLNPAVTLGLMSVGKVDVRTGAVHLAAQVVAALLAALSLQAFFPEAIAGVVAYGTPQLSLNVSLAQGIGLEALMTFFLMSAVFGTVVSADAPRIGGFGVGLTLVFLILGGGPLTGAAMNPARALGPAIAAGTWTGQAVYWIGPILGAVAASVVWDRFLLKGEIG
jgi:MIP family channel proteins